MTAEFPRVIAIGGAPRSGKSTVARLVAARLGYDHIGTDDLSTAARAATTPASDPDLHPMAGIDHRDYYLRTPADQLWQHFIRAHRALWPIVEAVMAPRLDWGDPAVIEGWAILPEFAAKTYTCWLRVDIELIEKRIRDDTEFWRGAADPEKVIAAFTGQCHRYNEHIDRTAPNVIRIGAETPDEICARILRDLPRHP
ncbi:hypothetical protein [Fodinicola acaciae]|uniref:hypothetical protein n=1 Tax=Fodinicola acaciae TaxID=2681555 RepID=UPI0013D3511E|nr:hypothetical protein [Fodinicola acaciae]